MMKIVEILDGTVHHVYAEYATVEEAYRHFSKTMVFVEAPDYVGEMWGFDPNADGDDRFIKPALNDGWFWDENGNPFNAVVSREMERSSMISRADHDALEAYRAKRLGDTSIDWDQWIDAIEDFVSKVWATTMQETYPEKVIYPEYPKKPTA